MLERIKEWFYWNKELVIIGSIITTVVLVLTIGLIVFCVNVCGDTSTDLNNISNPGNPVSPLNPMNPANPINHMR